MNILISPIISEKSMLLSTRGWYTFAVDKNSTKHQIAKAIEQQFKVNVVSVKTSMNKGKTYLTGRKRIMSKHSDWKKAIVQLKKEQKIELFNFSENSK